MDQKESAIQNNIRTQSKLIQDYIEKVRQQKKEIEMLQSEIDRLTFIIQDYQCMMIVNKR
uniref:cGMP-dependent protein kinase 1 n=1 Tax=Siphoviridae sp. ctgN495 TaxID=2825608 RepID=A0A8S5UD42_9CAUD|nr:MAG TPA: cGMP-dependent protein kinase 1 [Siphoviridae sp. ctgN495]